MGVAPLEKKLEVIWQDVSTSRIDPVVEKLPVE
jgi:hypothetical protein